jgi:hypothetical protein
MTIKRWLLSISLLFVSAGYLGAACPTGFQQVTDAFLLPNGSAWAGSITYTLAYNTTVAGASVVGSRVQFNVTNGFSQCLAPGLYEPVVLFQNGNSYKTTTQWSVGAAGPYTYAQIAGGSTLTGSALLTTTIAITRAQMLTLATTAQTLVAGVPGYVIYPTRYAVIVNGSFYQSDDQMVNVGFGTIESFTAGGTFGFLIPNQDSVFVDSTWMPGVLNGPSTSYSGQPLIAYANNAVTETGGTGGNVYLTVWYVLVQVQQ